MDSEDLSNNDWFNTDSIDDAWIYDWATTINDLPRSDGPIDALLRESLALDPSMFGTEENSSSNREETQIVEDPPSGQSPDNTTPPALEGYTPLSTSDHGTISCSCCNEVSGLKGDMAAILLEIKGLRDAVGERKWFNDRLNSVECNSVQFMEVVEASLAHIREEKITADEWMHGYQDWASVTHLAVEQLLGKVDLKVKAEGSGVEDAES